MIRVTRGCTAHGHPELTLVFRDGRPLAEPLLDWLEGFFVSAVAAGETFAPGEVVALGSGTLRVELRDDGTLGLWEETPDGGWEEHVDATLLLLWQHRAVADSLGLSEQLSFADPDQLALVADCAIEAPVRVLLRVPTDDDERSGHGLVCGVDHPHGVRRPVALRELLRDPDLGRWLALPPGVTVVLPDDPAAFQVFHDGRPLAPLPGSWLAAQRGRR